MSRTSTSGATQKQAQSAPMPPAAPAKDGLPLDKVAKRAYEKWVKAGCNHGCDKQHWFEAEAELRAELAKSKK